MPRLRLDRPRLSGSSVAPQAQSAGCLQTKNIEERKHHDRGKAPDQALRQDGGGRRGLLHRPARAGDRLPRPQRCRQVDHHAHDPGSGHPDFGRSPGRWQALPPAGRPTPVGRRTPGRQGHRRWPQRRQPPHVAGRQQRHRPPPGHRGARHRRTQRRRQESGSVPSRSA